MHDFIFVELMILCLSSLYQSDHTLEICHVSFLLSATVSLCYIELLYFSLVVETLQRTLLSLVNTVMMGACS